MILNFVLKKLVQRVNYKNFPPSFIRMSSIQKTNNSNRFKVNIIPALNDNFMYLLIDNARKSAIAIDPVEPAKILDCLKLENSELKAVLTTHHHPDHAGGNDLLLETVSNVPIYGGDDRIEAITIKLSHNEVFQIDETVIQCLHTPCHTSGHVCYFIKCEDPMCFTGDTLFVGGCGRFFEGSAEEMYKSLSILSKLPLNTKIYCGHEYTVNNLKFALSVEPNNEAILNKLKSAENCVRNNKPTVPTTIKEELSFNPFLRANEETVKKFTHETEPAAVIRKLRQMKDNFKP